MSTITYRTSYITPHHAPDVVVDYTGLTEKIVLERNPFNIPNTMVASYFTTSPSATYLPGELIDVPQSDIVLNALVINKRWVRVTTQDEVIHDISDALLNAVLKTGKNQPFSYVVLTLSKQLFLEANIELVQDTTPFTLGLYGINGTWYYDRLEDHGATIDITLINRALALKKTTLLSLLNFTTDGTVISLTNLGLSDIPITWSAVSGRENEGSFVIYDDTAYSCTIHIKKNTYTPSGSQVEQTDYSLIKLSGDVDHIFSFLARDVGGYTSLVIEDGYYYNVPSLSLIQDTYLMQDIEDLKNGTKNPIATGPSVLKQVSIRLDEFAWDILDSLAKLTNRKIIFSDRAYFVPFLPSEDKLSIDWEPPADDPQDDFTHITTLSLAENDDQGSQYLLSSQKVISEAYETTIAISDTRSPYVGQDIKYLATDNTQDSGADNYVRDVQSKVVALNALIEGYKPGDCVSYSVNETYFPTPDATIRDWSELSSIPSSAHCFLYQRVIQTGPDPTTDYLVESESYFTKTTGDKWVEFDTSNPKRVAAFDVTACVDMIVDEHNNITVHDCPLSLITIEFPACVTTYTWGSPEFMDEQTQFNSLSAVAQDSVLDNTGDTGISSGDATKIVIGNQYVHQLRDDRAGFTGLIMEKNLDNNVFRLIGYDQGVIQAQFNSRGKIEAGAGVAQLDEDGLTITYNSNNTEYNPQNALKFQKVDVSGTDSDGNPLTPYRLFTKYNSTSHTTSSIVQAQRQEISNVTYPATLSMVVDDGGATGAFTTYDSNANNALIGSIAGYEYSTTEWSGTKTPFTISSHTIPISDATKSYEIVVTLSNTTSPSVTVTTPSEESDSTPCAFIAQLANYQSFTFKNYNDNSKTSRGTRYVFSSGSSTVNQVIFRVKGATGASFKFDLYPINIYVSSGDGASISLDQTGTVIQGNNTINGQLYQTGGPVRFQGAGPNIPAYFEMPIVPFRVVSQNDVSGSTITAREGAELTTLTCRNICFAPVGSTVTGTFHVGDIVLYYEPQSTSQGGGS